MPKQEIEVHTLKNNIYNPQSPHIYSNLVHMIMNRIYQRTIENELPQILNQCKHIVDKYIY